MPLPKTNWERDKIGTGAAVQRDTSYTRMLGPLVAHLYQRVSGAHKYWWLIAQWRNCSTNIVSPIRVVGVRLEDVFANADRHLVDTILPSARQDVVNRMKWIDAAMQPARKPIHESIPEPKPEERPVRRVVRRSDTRSDSGLS